MKSSKVLALILIAGISLVFTSFLAASEPPMKVYVINSEPLGFIDSAGNKTGIHYEMVQEISRKTGIPMEINVVPKERIFQEIKTGSVDAGIFIPNKSWEDFTVKCANVLDVTLVAIGKKGLLLKTYNDLYKAKSIGMMPGTSITPEFDNDAKLNKQVGNNYEALVKMVNAERLDCIVGNSTVLHYLITKLKANNIESQELVLKTIPNNFHISKKSPFASKADQINRAIEGLKQNHVFDKIVSKYIGDTGQKD